MPIRRASMTPTEVLLAREACAPLLRCITDRLLRSGLAGFVEFRQKYGIECQRAVPGRNKNANNTSTAKPIPAAAMSSLGKRQTATQLAQSTMSAQQGVPPARRINPEGLKDVFAQSGILLSPEEYRSILVAYSDVVGFVLAEDLLAALHPCQHASLPLIRESTVAVAASLFADLPAVAEGRDGAAGGADVDFPAVTVGSVHSALSIVFAADVSEEELQSVANADASACVSALTSVSSDVDSTFSESIYTAGAVPAEDVVAFVVLALQQHPCLKPLVLARLGDERLVGSLAPAPPSSVNTRGANTTIAGPGGSSTLDGSALFSIRHTGAQTQRKFEYYQDGQDRRDEWIRGRKEADARPMYMRHAVGYGGHLPEYQYRFGRTFHVIEEDLPQLTKPKATAEPVPADWYGPGVELKDSRMNAHHYRMA